MAIAEKRPLVEDVRVPLYDRIPLSTPMSVTIDVSSICNMKCIYCAQALGASFDSIHFKRQLMTADTFDNIVGQLKAFPEKIKKIHLFRNGESLCNPLLPQMIKQLKDSQVCEVININTNAMLLNDDLSLALIDAGLDSLSVSLQGLSNTSYKRIGQVDFEFQSIVDKLAFFYENRKTCKLFIKNIDIALDQGEETTFYEIFEGIADRVFIESACPVYGSIDYSEILKKENVTRHGESVIEPEICQIAFFHLHILANGDVVPCSSIDSPIPVWNINEKTLLSIWNSKERNDFLLLQASKRRSDNEVCNLCHRLSQELRPEDNIDDYSQLILNRLER